MSQWWGNGYLEDDFDDLLELLGEMKTSTAQPIIKMLDGVWQAIDGTADQDVYYRNRMESCECERSEDDAKDAECSCGYQDDLEEVEAMESLLDEITDKFYEIADLYILEVCAFVRTLNN